MIRPESDTPTSHCQEKISAKPARDLVLRDHARIVGEFVGRYLKGRPEANRLDLEHAGTVGLLEAYETWNPTKFAFSTHAWHYVHRAIRAELGLPEDTRDEAGPVIVSLDEPTGEGDAHYEETLAGQFVAVRWDRFSDPTRGRTGQSFHPSTCDAETETNTTLDALRVHAAVEAAELTTREREVVQAVYFESQSFADTARALGISDVRVGQLHRSALAKLREVIS